jgi:hypothetical protein
VETFVRLAEPSCSDNGRLFDLRSAAGAPTQHSR